MLVLNCWMRNHNLSFPQLFYGRITWFVQVLARLPAGYKTVLVLSGSTVGFSVVLSAVSDLSDRSDRLRYDLTNLV